ncbi:MAG: 6-phosphofructokinase [Erysipelotrichaceae bacterium]|nr:6-phosphofructokinase [Erysipelotrichaceae bacterium]MBR2545468.1 6-phosphofructokinase [Erysipelotrichaceae bacterium]MBR2701111.1 6-phosphofructokinase [Erysipelotrichaceae bacterium]MBR2746136.1 6-phosphofructokinase [Erysipelotrichaceae bacterium]
MKRSIGILTSGGDAPGMNSAIRAIARSALARDFDVYGIYDGYLGLTEGNFYKMNKGSVSDILFKGGTILGTARFPEFTEPEIQEKAVAQMKKVGMDSLVVIGGDGTYRGAGDLCKRGISCIGIPGTIDNDCPGTDYTIGFHTALNTIVEAVDKLRDTSASHHRCSVVEVMGNHCGDLALYSAICCGAEIAVTPEVGFSADEVIRRLQHFDAIKKHRHALVIVSEKLTDVEKLAEDISRATSFSGRATVLGHIQRGGSPVPYDRLLASRMGDYAIEVLANGGSNFCIGIKNDNIIATPIAQALIQPKDFDQELYDMFERLA